MILLLIVLIVLFLFITYFHYSGSIDKVQTFKEDLLIYFVFIIALAFAITYVAIFR